MAELQHRNPMRITVLTMIVLKDDLTRGCFSGVPDKASIRLHTTTHRFNAEFYTTVQQFCITLAEDKELRIFSLSAAAHSLVWCVFSTEVRRYCF